MLRSLFLSAFLISLALLSACHENSLYFVFVGEKISLEHIPPKQGEIPFNYEFLAKYRILEPFRGEYDGSEIEFTVYDHLGTPAFSNFQHALLYVELHGWKYIHSKYQFSPLYKTKDGRWAGPYATVDYNHKYNKDSEIRPTKIEFAEPVVMDISDFQLESVEGWFPEPYYKIEGDKAIAVYGNYIEDLFLLKQSGVLKARGVFQ